MSDLITADLVDLDLTGAARHEATARLAALHADAAAEARRRTTS
jgi:hypothetical protein